MLTQLLHTLGRILLRPASVHFSPGRWFPWFWWEVLLLLLLSCLSFASRHKDWLWPMGVATKILRQTRCITHYPSFLSAFIEQVFLIMKHFKWWSMVSQRTWNPWTFSWATEHNIAAKRQSQRQKWKIQIILKSNHWILQPKSDESVSDFVTLLFIEHIRSSDVSGASAL